MSGTDFTVTPNYGLYKPIYNADDEAWGDHWNDNADVIDAQMAANAAAVGNYLPLAGGALTGPLMLAADPAAAMQPVTLQYFNAHAPNLAPYAPLASPALTGNPTAPTPSPGDNDTSLATTAFVQAAVAPALHNVGRNLLHNSMFNIAQRGAGPFTTNVFTLDRWAISVVSDTVSVIQFAIDDANRAGIGDEAATYILGNAFTGNAAAGAFNAVYQRIEDVRRLSGETVTVSFYAAGSLLKLGVGIDQNMGTGGSPSANVLGSGQSVQLLATWARYSLTFTVPSLSGKTLGTNGDSNTTLSLWFSSGANQSVRAGNIGVQSGSVSLWGVQLEIGSAATPLEKPDPRYDLANCQRFYRPGSIGVRGYNTTGTTLVMTYSFGNFMRAPPTVLFNTLGSANVGAPSASLLTQDMFSLQAIITTTGDAWLNASFTLDADL